MRLGQTVTVTLGEDAQAGRSCSRPLPPARTLDVHGRRVEVPADRIGLYAVKTPGAAYRFACNAVSRDESDLSAARTGRWGDWNDSPLHRDRQIGLRWVFLLLAMACLAAHLVVSATAGTVPIFAATRAVRGQAHFSAFTRLRTETTVLRRKMSQSPGSATP